MITRTISQEQLKEVHEGKETLEMVETETEEIEVTKGFRGKRTVETQIIYEVEGLGKTLVYIMGKGWVLKDHYNSQEEITLKEYFEKEQFIKDKMREKKKIQVANELKEMSTKELLKLSGGYEILQKLLKGEMKEQEAVGNYNYNGQTVFKITNNKSRITYWLYLGMEKIFHDDLTVFCQEVGLIKQSDLPYDSDYYDAFR